MFHYNIGQLKGIYRICILLGIILVGCGLFLIGYRYIFFYQKPVKHVLVLHSYAPDNERCLYMNHLLKKNLKKKGIRSEISYHYLDTERKNFQQRVDCYNRLLDSLSGNRPDVILINDDYAFYFYLKCGHPLIGEMPTVFSGIYQLDSLWGLLAKYPNITGKWDRVDYLANVRFIEKIFQKHVAITTYYELTYMAKTAHQEIHNQLKDCQDIRFNHYYLHQMYPDDPDFPADEELFTTLQKWGKHKIPYPFSVITFRPYRDLKGIAVVGQSGDIFTQEYFLNDLYGIITVPLGLSHISPTFTIINEPFGFWNAYLGGYFTSCEQQVEEQAELAARILSGTSPCSIPITESAKEYMVDWHALERFRLEKDLFPDGVRFMNMPFYERHKGWIITLSLILLLSVFSFITYVIYLYLREQKRTKEALYRMQNKNTSLELALQGGSTYVWKLQNDQFFFEHNIGNLSRRLTIDEFRTLVHPDDLPLFDSYRQAVYTSEKTVQQYRCKLIGLQYEWWEFRFSAVTNGREKQPEVSGLLINIQAVKDKEAELIQARKLAEKAELKQSFLANMSHEIRTPLNAIVGFANLLAGDEELDEVDKKEFIGTINKNCEILLMLINDILELSRLDSGQMLFEMRQCSVRELIEELYSTHRLLVPVGLQFLKEIPEQLPEVWTDKGRLAQVITNFITNACKFTKKGYIKLGFTYLEDTHEVSIFVEDSGKGISKEHQKMIFSRFYKQDEFAQGTGLGLAICQGITERLGGRIILDSEPGNGSRFAVMLPYL